MAGEDADSVTCTKGAGCTCRRLAHQEGACPGNAQLLFISHWETSQRVDLAFIFFVKGRKVKTHTEVFRLLTQYDAWRVARVQ